MGAGGYESWFISARDPVSPRALWIRHTRHRPRVGPESVALWCTVIDRDGGRQPTVVKEVLAAFPPGTAAGPGQFRGQAAMAGHHARWDLAVTGEQGPLRPLRPAALYRAPLPRTKLEAVVPDGQVTGSLELDGQIVAVSGWRGTVGHNWGSEHADSWVWLHAAGFGAAPEAWLELVLARIRVGPARSPWTAMGAVSLGGERIVLGGLGRRAEVDARPDGLAAGIPAAHDRLQVSVATDDDDPVAVTYTDPRGGTRTVRHAARAAVELTLRRRGQHELALTGGRGAYEFGTSHDIPGIVPQPLPEG